MTRLFHFSEDGAIARFSPRPVAKASVRPPGREWLNGPLVWAIDAVHQPMYLFPRDCPPILIWPVAGTTPEDLAEWWDERACRMVAYIEQAWFEALRRTRLYRYAFDPAAFESLDDAGMWVCREVVEPLAVDVIDDLPAALVGQDVLLRQTESLTPLRRLWSTSLHASGIRLRNARAGPHSTDVRLPKS